MKPVRLLRCAIYTRKSTEEGLEQAFNSLDAQRDACEAYIRSQAGEGWVPLPAFYDDGGFSGGNMERPALKRLLGDIDRGLIDVVVVYKVDRLTRALADFAKIVERFDKRNVSFVSVTQAFNTTSSMGRLTLNVLLSFAQFEREVTSERIRDKLAASRRKGLWTHGVPPFGYAVIDKKLVPDPKAAPILQRMFRRYLELSSVRLLRDELEAEGVRSRAWVSRHGNPVGGAIFDRGALYHLLQNRLYVGDIAYKEERHKGQHEAIVPLALFEAVQQNLSANRRRPQGAVVVSVKHPLVGLLHDDAGNRMSPATGHGRAGKRFRYYVSQACLKGQKDRQGEVGRVPADEIEALVIDRVTRLLGVEVKHAGTSQTPIVSLATIPPTLLQAVIERIELRPKTILIRLRREQLEIKAAEASPQARKVAPDLAMYHHRLPAGDELTETQGLLELVIGGGPVRRGGVTAIQAPDGSTPSGLVRHDPGLLKAIARAHGWLDLFLRGEARTLRDVAKREGIQERYVRRLIPAAFLPPEEVRALLEGKASRWSASIIADHGVPLAWR